MVSKLKWSKIKSKIHRLRFGFDSANYWENRYASGGNSGAGSYSRLAEFKAEVLNEFIRENEIKSVVEWGFGDCNQLRLFECEQYTGYDVSRTAVDFARNEFSADASKEFFHTSEFEKANSFDVSISLDVIYHLIEDVVFHHYMSQLFSCTETWVIIYASNEDKPYHDGHHVKHRKFTNWISENKSNWKLFQHIPNRFPFEEDNQEMTSFADFFIFKKETS